MQRIIAVFFALTVAMPVALYEFGPAPLYAALSNSGLKAQGVVVASTCESHRTFQFTFALEGRSYSGVGRGHDECSQFTTGVPVSVVYLPSNPALNLYGDPAIAYHDELIFISLVTLFAPGLITFAIRKRVRMHA